MKDRSIDIVALGELLVDFTPVAPRTFQANAGGAPANVLAAAAQLGLKTAFIGMVGRDGFGTMLRNDLIEAGIDSSGLVFTDEAATTLAFVELNEQGDRSFTFTRKPGADMLLTTALVDYSLIDDAQVFHFGSVSMTDEPSRSATLAAAAYARKQGKMVSYDPNLRPLLWCDLETARDIMIKGLSCADILKISHEELEFLTGTSQLETGGRKLLEYGICLVFVTLGPNGCFFLNDRASGLVPTYDTRVVDTTGSGDAFMGGVLASLLENDKRPGNDWRREELIQIGEFANAMGSLAATKKGGIAAMPSRGDVAQCMQTMPKLICSNGEK